MTNSTGELIRLQEGLKDEKLAKFIPIGYDAKTRDGSIYIPLENLRDRIAEVKQKFTNTICDYKKDRSIKLN